MKHRGRPVLGALSGLFLGVFAGLDLVMFKLIGSASVLLLILPVAGLVVGVAGALAAPFGRSSAAANAAARPGAVRPPAA